MIEIPGLGDLILTIITLVMTGVVGFVLKNLVDYIESLEEGVASRIGEATYNMIVEFVETAIRAAWDKMPDNSGEERLEWVIDQVMIVLEGIEDGLMPYIPIEFSRESVETLVRGVYNRIVEELGEFEPGV